MNMGRKLVGRKGFRDNDSKVDSILMFYLVYSGCQSLKVRGQSDSNLPATLERLAVLLQVT